MEEIEVPTEQLQEEIHHHAEHSGVTWISQVALSSALFAVLAAIAALLAGFHSNEALIDQVKASDQWSYYQAKSIKSLVMSNHLETLAALGKAGSAKQNVKLQEYQKDKATIASTARKKQQDSEDHMRRHEIFSRAVTLLQVAIALSAIAALVKSREFWYFGLAFGLVGLLFFVHGFLPV